MRIFHINPADIPTIKSLFRADFDDYRPKLDDPAAECPETALLPTTGASDQYLAGWVQHYPKDGYEQQQPASPVANYLSENLTGRSQGFSCCANRDHLSANQAIFYIQQHYGKSLLSLPHQILTLSAAAAARSIESKGRIEMPLPNSIAARIVVAFAGPIPEICITFLNANLP